MIENIQETKVILVGSLVGSRIKNEGLGCVSAINPKKGGGKGKLYISISIKTQPESCQTNSFLSEE